MVVHEVGVRWADNACGAGTGREECGTHQQPPIGSRTATNSCEAALHEKLAEMVKRRKLLQTMMVTMQQSSQADVPLGHKLGLRLACHHCELVLLMRVKIT